MNSLTTKTKILIPMFILTVILIFIGGSVTYINYSKINSLQKLQEKIFFSSKIATLLHSLQRERGLSCGFVVNANNKYRKELLEQRSTTDIAIKDVKMNLHTIKCPIFKKNTDRILTKLAQLQIAREEIDKYNISYNGVIKFYSNINTALLDVLVNISKESHIPLLTQNILAYSNLLYLKEFMGIERARGVAIYSKHHIDRESLIQFSNIFILEKRSEEMFFKYASEEMKLFYKQSIQDKSFTHVSAMRENIFYKNIQNSSIDSKKWFDTITKSLNILDKVATFIEKKTIINIQKELSDLKTVFIILTSLTIISIVVFVMMLIAFFKLAREEQRLRIVMDKYIISSTTDLKGKIIDVSQAFCNISGYKKEELIGQPHNIVRHPDTPKEVFKDMWYRLQRGLAWRGKVKNRKKDGSFYWVYANVEPLFAAGGNIDSYISIRLDITESELLTLKVKEEEEKNRFQVEMMKEQSRLVQMGEMLSMIAHQWRQPLSAIAAAAGSLQIKAKMDKLEKETLIEIAEKITGFSLHLSSTIDDFRNFFKSNKMSTKTNFEVILQSVLSIIEGSMKENSITLQINIKDVEEFTSYENELKQVLLNLMKNAEDALVENEISEPKIEISIEKKSFTIKDNAGGIPKEIIDKIFDPYFSTKMKKDGTGLGLYMSKMIIEDHCNGYLKVINDVDGALFTITIGEKND